MSGETNHLPFEPIPRLGTVREMVYNALLAGILEGAISKETVLTEAGVAQKMGVSRTPVREALNDLARVGLLEAAGQKGKRVRRITVNEARELYWLRRALEGQIVTHLAKKKLRPHDIAQLERLIAAQRATLRKPQPGRFLTIDTEFHLTMAKLTGFPRAAEIMTNIRLNLALLGLRAISSPGRMQAVLAEHARIVRALSRCDPVQARQAILTHIDNTEIAVLKTLAP
jgi:DNA-binding GntR family transcriptional regulator